MWTKNIEIWIWVYNYKGYYKVSTHGRVKSVERILQRNNWRKITIKERILKLYKHRNGHLYVWLYKNGKGKKVYVHTLVLESFKGPRPSNKECRHYPERNPENNHVCNLRWGSKKQNQADRIKHGTHNRGERNGSAKLTKEQVIWARKKREKHNISYGKLAKILDVDRSHLWRLVNGQRWSHLK